jgi:hypothetical protein
VAILPQLFIIQRTGEAENITTHYLFALGAYRALYIPNWIYRYVADDYWDPIAVVAGVIQVYDLKLSLTVDWIVCGFRVYIRHKGSQGREI